ncbi:hypothetical protein [Burkholderia ubonensis]|uniref:hypothetical protein n=1 Tax=Burkholderia ubonensis TaxID=101571 RepID=UPI0011603F1E|nr:hypothetical protein [Burkholderia ubonensis]
MRIISKDLKLFKNQRVVTNCQGFWGVLRGFLQSIAGVWTLSALCNARIALGPVHANNGLALAARRAERRVMLLANTLSIRFVPFLALGPSGGQRKPVISVNRP